MNLEKEVLIKQLIQITVILAFILQKLTNQEQRILIKKTEIMDKLIWKQVNALSSSSHKPSSRWGHSCCVVGEEILFFGGYADSIYMNDLWSFNSNTMKWTQIETFGDIPAQRSNCSMNYDSEKNQIIIFGGGGSNKQRFNSISILDLTTKKWVQVCPKQNEQAPWERTYHVAEFLGNHLIVYGGEGVADMDDLWLFNFDSLSWTQIKIPADKVKPCARRFHSSVIIGNQFFVLAGCHGKYRCLSDIFSMDFTTLIETGKTDYLEWKQTKMKNSSFLTRWGHSSSVYDKKIYIFGGRFSNDLNDLLVADFETNTIKQIKTNPQAPTARRRHCSGFIGSSLLVFGGFNGEYFQDLNYVSVYQSKTKLQTNISDDEKNFVNLVNNHNFADYAIKSTERSEFYINVGMISDYFENSLKMQQFIDSIDGQYSVTQLNEIFTVLYKGFGDLNLKPHDIQRLRVKSQFPQTKFQKQLLQRQRTQKKTSQPLVKAIKKSNPQSNLIKLCQQEFSQYYIQRRNKPFADQQILIGQNKFAINRIKLMIKSQYFINLLGGNHQQIDLTHLAQNDKVLYDIFFAYMQTDWLVLPDNFSPNTLMQLAILADYFCVAPLNKTCCNELITMIAADNVETILSFAFKMKLTNLSKACSDFWIKKASQSLKVPELMIQINKSFGGYKKMAQSMVSTLNCLKFDLVQVMMQSQKLGATLCKKTQSTSSIQKQNFQMNVYNH